MAKKKAKGKKMESLIVGSKAKAALKKANTRQAVLNAYWKHKKEHEKLLAKHLKEEMDTVKKIKDKMEYR